jgi:hypothetical protein
MDTLPKTVTLDELTDALKRVRILTGRDASGMSKYDSNATYPDALARDLFRDVEKNREPLYEGGAVYVDAYGEKWVYSSIYKAWYAFGSEIQYAFETPKRPLRKLVPEFKFNGSNVNLVG